MWTLYNINWTQTLTRLVLVLAKIKFFLWLQVDVFDKVYSEITKKILKETDIEYYKEVYGSEPLDLSMPKDPPECEFCYQHYSAMYCLFYKRRDTKLPPSGPVCYCCDSEEESTEPEQQPSDLAGDRRPVNPGWFGKGYRKKLKKKR